MEKCAELEKKMLKELEMIEGKLGNTEMSAADLDKIDKLAHALKSLATYKAMKGYCDDEEEEWSGRRGRASNGRYMSMAPYEPGYSGYPPVYGEWRPIR